jgi:hypothetical protein
MISAIAQLAPADEPEQADTWLPPEIDRARNGWRPVIFPQPCGRQCCRVPLSPEPVAAPPREVVPDEYDRPETAAAMKAFAAQWDVEVSGHEAAHGIGAIACGCTVTKLEVGSGMLDRADGIGGLCWYITPPAFGERIVVTLAGPIGERTVSGTLASFDRDAAARYVGKVRQQTDGNCDSCHVAARLHEVAPEVSDAGILDLWETLYDRTARLFAHPVVRRELDKLTLVLQQQRCLTTEQIDEVVDASAMQAAYAEIKSPK